MRLFDPSGSQKAQIQAVQQPKTARAAPSNLGLYYLNFGVIISNRASFTHYHPVRKPAILVRNLIFFQKKIENPLIFFFHFDKFLFLALIFF